MTPPNQSERPQSHGNDGATDRDEPVARVVTLAMLLANGPVTLQEIRDLMPREYGGTPAAVRKRFQRDKDTLEATGLRVAVERDRYWLDAPTEIRRRGLTAPERYALADAVHAVSDAVHDDVRRLATAAVLKLRAAEADPAATADSVTPGADPTVVAFENARRTQSPLAFTYTAASGATTERIVHPWAVALRGDVWLVLGWDETRDAPRHFRVDGVDPGSLRPVDVSYRPSPGPAWLTSHFGTAPWAWGDGAPVDAEVLVVGDAPPPPHDLPPGTRVEPVDDDRFGFRLTVAVRDPAPFLSWLLRFGDDARLEGPDELVAALGARLRAVIASLDGAPPVLDRDAFGAAPTGDSTVTAPATLRPAARRAARILQLLGLASGVPVERERLADLLGCGAEELDADLDQLFAHCYLPPDAGGNWFDVEPATGTVDSVRIVGPDPGAVAELSDLETAALGICARLHLATHPLEPAEAQTLRDALDVLGLLPPGVEERPVGTAEFRVFAAVAEALRSSRRVRFTYTADGTTTEREVDPQRLSVSAGRRYVTGWDHLRGAQRAFRLDRITELEVTGTTFDPSALTPLPARADGDPGFVPVGEGTIEVVLPATWSRWAERRFGPSALRHGEDGALLTLRSNDPGRYAATLLSMLPDGTLVGPSVARDVVRDLATALLAAVTPPT